MTLIEAEVTVRVEVPLGGVVDELVRVVEISVVVVPALDLGEGEGHGQCSCYDEQVSGATQGEVSYTVMDGPGREILSN